MLKTILNVGGVHTLSKNQQKSVTGGSRNIANEGGCDDGSGSQAAGCRNIERT